MADISSDFWRITLDTNPEDCNLHCIMCEEHSLYSNFITILQTKTGVKRRLMPIEWVEKAMKEAKELGAKEVIPSTMGEPLLYEGIERIVELCKIHGILLNLTTNGTFPRKSVEEWAKLLIPVLCDMKISWNGVTQETVQKIMLGLDFNKTLEKLKIFILMRNEYYRLTGHYARISFQTTFMQNNIHELAEMVKLAAQLGVDRVKGHHVWTHFDEIKHLSCKNSPELWNKCVKEAYDARDRYLKPDGSKVILENIIPLEMTRGREVTEDYECPFLNQELWISATGQISPCCAPDEQRKTLGDFGNIQYISLYQVLITPKYQKLVENYKDMPVCKVCNMRKPKR